MKDFPWLFIFITISFLLIMFLLLSVLIPDIIFYIKRIYRMEAIIKRAKLIEIICTAIVFGSVAIIGFLSVVGYISLFTLFVVFCIGGFIGALISLEDPRPSLTSEM